MYTYFYDIWNSVTVPAKFSIRVDFNNVYSQRRHAEIHTEETKERWST